jgi:hypothetical protein
MAIPSTPSSVKVKERVEIYLYSNSVSSIETLGCDPTIVKNQKNILLTCRVLRFLQQCCWKFQASGTLHCVVRPAVPDVSTYRSVLTFKIKQFLVLMMTALRYFETSGVAQPRTQFHATEDWNIFSVFPFSVLLSDSFHCLEQLTAHNLQSKHFHCSFVAKRPHTA